MYKFSKLIYALLLVVLIVWLLPWFYEFALFKPESSPFTLYSRVIDDFVFTEVNAENQLIRKDSKGNEYTAKEFDNILPLFYARQLVADARFPDSITGVPVSPQEVQIHNFVFRSTPSEINKPSKGLYFLLEAMSGRVDLSMPSDVFRITSSGIEFVEMENNAIDKEKSKLFTDLMLKKDFVFPAKLIEGNPSTRKDYDEGYLLTDQENKLYHLKMLQGKPYLRVINLPEGLKLTKLFVTEFRGKRTLGLLVDEQHKLYALTPDYSIKQVEVPSFDPNKEVITLFGNLFHWTVQVTGEGADRFYAIDAKDYTLIREYICKAKNDSFADKYRNVLMPIRLTFTSGYDKFVKPRINE